MRSRPRDYPDRDQSGRRPLLQRARNGGAMDQGRQSRDALDAPLLPPLPRERGPPAPGSYRVQPRQFATSAEPAVGHPELVANEPPATGLQDRRTPHPACPVLHPAACRKLLDGTPLSADSRAHRAVRMAPHVIEKAGHGGREKRNALGGSISRPDGRREQTFGRWAVSLAGGAGTAHVTPSERQKGPVARHVVCSATRGSEDLGPNRKFRLKGKIGRASCRERV